MVVRFGCIVEGPGDKAAIPTLIQRIAQRFDPALTVAIRKEDILVRPKSKLVKQSELQSAVELVARRLAGQGGVLIVLDSDEDCPAEWGPRLLTWAQEQRGNLPIAVVLAKTEFESWFIAAAQSLRGQNRLSAELVPLRSLEDIRGAKEWLNRNMPRDQPYSETTDQQALTRLFDLDQARSASSFDKCYREIVKLLTTLQPMEPGRQIVD
ncbi:MAG: DUF4276 family protein [Chloroflexi bacterium]|nr:DUF4276 family protein [Chloroflexota bacterium]